MWCVGRLTEEYQDRMGALLELYARPYGAEEPVVCLDEKSKQMLKDTRAPQPMKPGIPAKQDYEYVRKGTCNLFVAVEPKGHQRFVEVTARRTKIDFVDFVRHLVEQIYGSAKWCSTTSIPTSDPASRRSWVRRLRTPSCSELSFTTRPNMRAGSTWRRSRSVSWIVSASIDVFRIAPP